MELEQTFRDTMDFSEGETSSVSFLQPLPTVPSSIQRTQSIAAALIKALEPIASNSEQDAALIASAMIKGLTSNSTQKQTSIASVLINALEPIAFPTPYTLRQKQTTAASKHDRQSAGTPSCVSSHEEWAVPQSSSHVFRPKQPTVSPKLDQKLCNDIVRDLGLSKRKSTLFASRLVQLMKEDNPNVLQGKFNICQLTK